MPANAQDGALHVLSVRGAEPPDCERIVIEFDGESGKAYEVFFKDDVLARFARWGLAAAVPGDADGTTIWTDEGDAFRDPPWLVPFRFYQLYLQQDLDADGLTDGAESLIHGTVPDNADPDGDNLNDSEELSQGRIWAGAQKSETFYGFRHLMGDMFR